MPKKPTDRPGWSDEDETNYQESIKTYLKGYTKVNNFILLDDSLTPKERNLLFLILMHMFGEKEYAVPGRKRLARMLGDHPNNISVMTRKLQELGYLAKYRRGTVAGRTGSTNRYEIGEKLRKTTDIVNTLDQSGIDIVNTLDQSGIDIVNTLDKEEQDSDKEEQEKKEEYVLPTFSESPKENPGKFLMEINSLEIVKERFGVINNTKKVKDVISSLQADKMDLGYVELVAQKCKEESSGWFLNDLEDRKHLILWKRRQREQAFQKEFGGEKELLFAYEKKGQKILCPHCHGRVYAEDTKCSTYKKPFFVVLEGESVDDAEKRHILVEIETTKKHLGLKTVGEETFAGWKENTKEGENESSSEASGTS